MATQPAQLSRPESMNQRVLVARWDNLANGDMGAAVEVGAYTDLSVQAFGVFGSGGELRVQGSLTGVSNEFVTFVDERGNTLQLFSTAARSITDPVRWLQLWVYAGDGTTLLSVVICGRLAKRRNLFRRS